MSKQPKKPVAYLRYFIGRFWPLTIWVVLTLSIFWKTYKNFKTQPEYYYLRTILGWWLCISRGTAPVITLCSLLVLLPVCRSLHTILHSSLAKISSRLLAVWLSKVKTMHIVCATTLVVFSMIHTGAHVMNAIHFSKHYTAIYPDINLAKYKGENPLMLICIWTGYTGIAMLILLLLMAFTSTSKFRLKHFNAFYVTHHLLIIYLLLLLTHPFSGVLKEQNNVNQHKPGCILIGNKTMEEGFPEPTPEHPGFCTQPPKFKCMSTKNWIWVSLALTIYVIELGYRKFRCKPMKAIQACHVIKNAIHLRIKCPNDFKIDPGQYVLLQCTQLSSIEWHPFTVTKCPDLSCNSFEVLISIRGDWTKSLHKLVKVPFCYNECNSYIAQLQHKPLEFFVDGPFVSPMQSFKTSKFAICIAAGIGITSYIATLRHLLITKTYTPKRIHLLWLTRDPKQLMWYSKLLNELQEKFWNDNQPDRFQVQLFVTKDPKNDIINNLFGNSSFIKRIHIGRPNWKEEFRLWNFMYKRNKVCVFCCGPKTLRQEIRTLCADASYTFIQEGF